MLIFLIPLVWCHNVMLYSCVLSSQNVSPNPRGFIHRQHHRDSVMKHKENGCHICDFVPFLFCRVCDSEMRKCFFYQLQLRNAAQSQTFKQLQDEVSSCNKSKCMSKQKYFEHNVLTKDKKFYCLVYNHKSTKYVSRTELQDLRYV